MSERALPDFDDLADVLAAAGALASPAELQGQLCGQLAAGQALERRQWIASLPAQCDMQQALSANDQAVLGQLFDYSASALVDADFAWQLALPGEDQDIDERIDQLAGWCQGFLAGVGLVKGHTPTAEFEEVLEDFAAIAQVGAEDDGEEAEQSLFELVEYVRLAALNAYLLTHRQGDGPPPEDGAGSSAATPADLFKRRLH